MTNIPPPQRSNKGTPPALVAATPNNLDRPESGALVPLNFRVTPEFRRELKAFAVANDLSMLDIMHQGITQFMERRSTQ